MSIVAFLAGHRRAETGSNALGGTISFKSLIY
jgi:hypothetical protein